jgi:hypothetical protein
VRAISCCLNQEKFSRIKRSFCGVGVREKEGFERLARKMVVLLASLCPVRFIAFFQRCLQDLTAISDPRFKKKKKSRFGRVDFCDGNVS